MSEPTTAKERAKPARGTLHIQADFYSRLCGQLDDAEKARDALYESHALLPKIVAQRDELIADVDRLEISQAAAIALLRDYDEGQMKFDGEMGYCMAPSTGKVLCNGDDSDKPHSAECLVTRVKKLLTNLEKGEQHID